MIIRSGKMMIYTHDAVIVAKLVGFLLNVGAGDAIQIYHPAVNTGGSRSRRSRAVQSAPST